MSPSAHEFRCHSRQVESSFGLAFGAGFWSRSTDITIMAFKAMDSSAELSAYEQKSLLNSLTNLLPTLP